MIIKLSYTKIKWQKSNNNTNSTINKSSKGRPKRSSSGTQICLQKKSASLLASATRQSNKSQISREPSRHKSIVKWQVSSSDKSRANLDQDGTSFAGKISAHTSPTNKALLFIFRSMTCMCAYFGPSDRMRVMPLFEY